MSHLMYVDAVKVQEEYYYPSGIPDSPCESVVVKFVRHALYNVTHFSLPDY